MHDVAREAGVSLKTVSRVVNDEGGVSPEFTNRVEAAITELGYRPDDRARRLRQAASRTGTIGFVLVDVANPFFSSILRGIEEVARARDYLVLAGSTDGSPARERQLVERFIGRRVDGLIVVPSAGGDDLLRAEIKRGSPVVLLDLEIESAEPVDLVRSDHYGGAKAATEHLLELGHRDIAYMGDDPDIMSARHRLKGFRDAMAEAGIEVHESRVFAGTHTDAQWRFMAGQFFGTDTQTTAVFTAQNLVTMGVVTALHDLGLQHSVAVVGFDEIAFGEVIEPGITVIPQQPRELGRRAAELLFDQIDGSDRPRAQIVIDHELIQRGSGEILPTRDRLDRGQTGG
jgi:LacI family transcriptional regulator